MAATVDFDSFRVGEPPPGWLAGITGSGNARWLVEKGVWTKADSVTAFDDFQYEKK
jgi:hypothetical protein